MTSSHDKKGPPDTKSVSKPLSTSRASFLEIPSFYAGSYSVRADELVNLVAHFNKKHAIKIFINGETIKGQEFIKTNVKTIQDKINEYAETNKLRYANYLKRFWLGDLQMVSKTASFEINKISPEYLIVKQAISKFLDNTNAVDASLPFRKNLSTSEIEELNTIISQLTCVKEIDNKINRYIDHLRNEQKDCCILGEQVANEVYFIQKSLQENEAVGYMFTNNHRLDRDHFEALIITKNQIIKPVFWDMGMFKIVNNDTLPHATTPYVSGILAQADGSACATLSLLYLKELLKNNHQQLDEYCLEFPYYKKGTFGEIELKQCFFPSPHVLRYSQSKRFNTLMEQMLKDADEIVIHKSEDEDVSAETIKKLLTESMAIAKEEKNDKVYEENKKILDALPTFREKWHKEYNSADMKRKQMDDVSGLNRYLAYRSKKMETLAKSKTEVKTKEPPNKGAQVKK